MGVDASKVDCNNFDPKSAFESAFCTHVEITGDYDAAVAESNLMQEARDAGFSAGGYDTFSAKMQKAASKIADTVAPAGSTLPLYLGGAVAVGIGVYLWRRK